MTLQRWYFRFQRYCKLSPNGCDYCNMLWDRTTSHLSPQVCHQEVHSLLDQSLAVDDYSFKTKKLLTSHCSIPVPSSFCLRCCNILIRQFELSFNFSKQAKHYLVFYKGMLFQLSYLKMLPLRSFRKLLTSYSSIHTNKNTSSAIFFKILSLYCNCLTVFAFSRSKLWISFKRL